MKGWEKALVAILIVVVIILAVFYLVAYMFDTIVPNWLFVPAPPGKKSGFVAGGMTYGHPPPMQMRAPIPRRA